MNIGECMRQLKTEYPDLKQRYAVCINKINKKEASIDTTTDSQIVLKIFPKKSCYVVKYNKWLNFDDEFFNTMINTFYNSKLPKPFVNVDHIVGESYGEIKDLLIEDDGMYAVIELTDLGKNLINNELYRYTSPSWFESIPDSDNKIWYNYLYSVSLVNLPALLDSVDQIQEQIVNRQNNELKLFSYIEGGTQNMSKSNLTKYDLSAVTDESIKKLIEELIAQGEKKEEIIASLEKQIEELKAQLQQKIDEIEENEAKQFVEQQVSLGLIHVSVSDFWKDLYKKDKEKVKKYFELSLEQSKTHSKVTKSIDTRLSEEDILVLRSLGMDLTEDNIKLYLKANKTGGQ